VSTPERVQQLLEHRLGLDRPDTFCRVKGPLSERANSRIYYVECSRYPFPLAVKLCLKPHQNVPDVVGARDQFRALQKAYSKMGTQDFTVPRPIDLCHDEGMIVTEWMPGKSVTELLYSARYSPRSAPRLMIQAGQWLRSFHEAFLLPPGILNVEERLPVLLEMETHPASRHGTFFRAIDGLRQYAEAAAFQKLPRSWIHGDFKTDNLMVSGQRTVGMDVHVRHQNVCVYDIASFMNQLELTCLSPRGLHLYPMRKQLFGAFLKHYYQSNDSGSVVPLLWVRLYSMLCLWRSLEEQRKAWFELQYFRQCFRHTAKQILNDLERIS